MDLFIAYGSWLVASDADGSAKGIVDVIPPKKSFFVGKSVDYYL